MTRERYRPILSRFSRPPQQYLFVAIDRTSKAAFTGLHPRAKRVVAAESLRRVLDRLPCRDHTVLTDNGVQFTPQAQ